MTVSNMQIRQCRPGVVGKYQTGPAARRPARCQVKVEVAYHHCLGMTELPISKQLVNTIRGWLGCRFIATENMLGRKAVEYPDAPQRGHCHAAQIARESPQVPTTAMQLAHQSGRPRGGDDISRQAQLNGVELIIQALALGNRQTPQMSENVFISRDAQLPPDRGKVVLSHGQGAIEIEDPAT